MRAENELRKKLFLQAQEGQKKRDLDRLNKLLEAAYLISGISMHLLDEAEEILERNNLVFDNVITEKQKAYQDACDIYCKEFATMIKADIEKKHFWQNLEELEKKFRRWAGLNNAEIIEWHKVGDRLPCSNEKVIVVTRNGKYALSEYDKGWKGSGKFTSSIIAWRPVNKYREDKNG